MSVSFDVTDPHSMDSLVALVSQNTGRTDKEDVAEQAIKFGLVNLSQTFPFDELRREINVPLATGVLAVNLPANCDQIIELRLVVPGSPTMSYSLDYRRKTWFVKRFPNVANTVVTGRPLYCYREGSTLYLDRYSNGEYSIRVSLFSTGRFAGDSETPILDSDECLVAYATASVYKSIQMYTDFKFWMGEYVRLLGLLVNYKNSELGINYVAEEWTHRLPIFVNQPWLDPFSGQREMQ